MNGLFLDNFHKSTFKNVYIVGTTPRNINSGKASTRHTKRANQNEFSNLFSTSSESNRSESNCN